jgi:hypothetical protein
MSLTIKPCHLRAAQEFVGQYHRHSLPPVGGKFALACYEGNNLCGVAICGRPVSRYLDNGMTLEILRCCTDGTRNACSKLYGACCRVGFAMGYESIITYTLATESGASLRAAGFTFDGEAGGRHWTGARHRDYYVAPAELKNRWIKRRAGGEHGQN